LPTVMCTIKTGLSCERAQYAQAGTVHITEGSNVLEFAEQSDFPVFFYTEILILQ